MTPIVYVLFPMMTYNTSFWRNGVIFLLQLLRLYDELS